MVIIETAGDRRVLGERGTAVGQRRKSTVSLFKRQDKR